MSSYVNHPEYRRDEKKEKEWFLSPYMRLSGHAKKRRFLNFYMLYVFPLHILTEISNVVLSCCTSITVKS